MPHGNKKYTKEVIEAIADEMVDYFKQNKDAATLSKFIVVEKGITLKQMDRFVQENEYFKKAKNKVKEILKNRLIEGGLTNSYNSQFTKFILSVNHGMKEVQHVEQKTELTVNKPLSELFNEIDSEIK